MQETPIECRPQEMPVAQKVSWDIGYLGHYLYQNFGGRSGQAKIVVALDRRGGHMTQRELQERFGIKSASLSEVLAKLEADALITRKKSSEDRRQMIVELTDAGHARAKELFEERVRFDEQALSCLSADEQEQLLVMLDKLVVSWHEKKHREEGGK